MTPRGDNLEEFRFRPGQSGNPRGRPPIPAAAKNLARYERRQVLEAFGRVFEMTVEQCVGLLVDEGAPKFERAIASYRVNGGHVSSVAQLDRKLDRIVGKDAEFIGVELKREKWMADHVPPKIVFHPAPAGLP